MPNAIQPCVDVLKAKAEVDPATCQKILDAVANLVDPETGAVELVVQDNAMARASRGGRLRVHLVAESESVDDA